MDMVKQTAHFFTGMTLWCLLFFAASAAAATPTPLNLSQVPLYLGGNVKPNIILSVDDSGSMDSEVLLQTNDGALWWETGAKSFTGRDRNDALAPGVINFNKVGGAGTVGSFTWKKYVYLFPNGIIGTGNRVYADLADDHYAVPPLPQYAYTRSPAYNAAYFDPAASYKPWAGYGSTTFPDMGPTAAKSDPTRGTSTFDLTSNRQSVLINETFRMHDGMTLPAGTYYQDWTTLTWKTAASAISITNPPTGFRDVPIRYFPATFYLPAGTALPAGYGYTPLPIAGGKGPAGQTLDGYEIKPGNFSSTAAYNAAMQNFANWFSYYRKRHAATRGGIGESFKDITNVRLGSFTINNRTAVTMRDMSVAADRNSSYSTVYNTYVGSGGTPNREALDYLGTQFMRSDVAAPITLACQQNYGVMFTDGYSNASTPTSWGNVDGTKGSPYADSVSNTIADTAMYYYSNNLRPTLPTGKVRTPSGCSSASPDPRLDCNANLHMVTFGVILGVPGEIFEVNMAATSDPYANPPTWPTSFPTRHPSAIDDLWHATINGRGSMLNARTPAAIATQFSAVVNAIAERNSSASSVALNSGSISANSRLYQAKFNSGNWTGELLAIPVNLDGTLGTEVWNAATVLNGQDPDSGRKILTYKPSALPGKKGIPFRWPANPLYMVGTSTLDPSYVPGAGELDRSQITALNTNPTTGLLDVVPPNPPARGSDRLRYLRGTEVSGFRSRTQKLGDIVYSSPAYVGAPRGRYPDSLESQPYSTFKSGKASRAPMIYVGANDGMLHGFDAANGGERFAYVPAALFKDLNQLTNPAYTHRFYVDGSPTVGDAFFGGDWHTVLVSGLRRGGQGIYALDVTDPPASSDTESAITPKVLWEFTDANDSDLGYTFSEPNLVRMHNGKWAAVFGNGYNNTEDDTATGGAKSTTGNAVLYIVDIADGSLIAKIDTKKGYLQDPTGSNRPNGLATPAPIDANGDSIVDYIYAGDLSGNLWKFDVNASSASGWKVAYGSTSAPQPLYTACAGATCTTGATSNYQPITTRPEVGRHPTQPGGYMVYFGTGKYIESGDSSPTGQTTQSFYGIWDQNQTSLTAFGRSDLRDQQITKEVSQTFAGKSYDLRVTTKNAIDWTPKPTGAGHLGWYMDLINTGASPLDNAGEKQVTDSILRNGRIIFTTLIPSVDPCDFGGTGWLMELNAATGGQLDAVPFDLNGDGIFNNVDYVDLNGDGIPDVPPSGKKSTVGIPSQPGVAAGSGENDKEKEFKYINGSKGTIETTVENAGKGYTGRTSWRELSQ